jgi:hypothetical protein
MPNLPPACPLRERREHAQQISDWRLLELEGEISDDAHAKAVVPPVGDTTRRLPAMVRLIDMNAALSIT